MHGLAAPRQIVLLIEVLQDQSEQEPELVALRAIIDQCAVISVVVACLPELQSRSQRDGITRAPAVQVGLSHVPQLLHCRSTHRPCCDLAAARLSSEGLDTDRGVGYGCGTK